MIRIGVVVQRYGKEVVGGAETLAREIAERLSEGGYQVTVYTTTAQDYLSWKNHYRAGESILHGVRIRRFPVESNRDIEHFNRLSEELFREAPGKRDEIGWIIEQGPFCPELPLALASEQQDIDLFIFFTYLYYPVSEGMKMVRKPIIFFPTAHDEPPLYLDLMRPLFKRPEAIFFLTQSEMDLVRRVFIPQQKLELVRYGLDLIEAAAELFRRRWQLATPYLLYAGRIEAGKGLATLFQAFAQIRSRYPVELVLLGKQLMEIPATPGILYAGYVTEEEKQSAFRSALCSIQPSPLESLSITTLESFAQRTPVLVNRHCPVLQEHVRLSGGGLEFGNAEELVADFELLFRDREMRQTMGERGYAYVNSFFTWEAVMQKVRQGIAALLRQS